MDAQPDFVTYNGKKMVSYWPALIEAAQQEPSYVINGQVYPRVRYGEEDDDWGANRQPCHDCMVDKGQFHVSSCDVERCPICGGQALSCDCQYEDDKVEAFTASN